MRFALLGSGAEAMELAQAVERHADHRLAAISESTAPGTDATPRVTWESLLNPEVAEAVIVGHADEPDRRTEQLRQLVQASVPMILVHPACEAIVGYELDMIRHDTECIMIPYSPGLAHPAIHAIGQLVRQPNEAPLGKLEQLLLERRLTERGREGILRQLAQDAFVIRQILGNVEQLTALGPTPGQADYASLNVHFSGSSEVLARWSIDTTEQQAGARMCLLGSEDRATIELGASGGVQSWEIPGVALSEETVTPWDGPAAAIDSLVQGVAGRETLPTWDAACRAADLADTVDVSLRRGRTIDVHTQPCTEEDTFKGVMAIGGCGALLLTLAVILVLAVVESFNIAFLDHPFWQQYPWRILYWRNWPFYLLGLLTFFLSLQLFRFLYPNSNRSD